VFGRDVYRMVQNGQSNRSTVAAFRTLALEVRQHGRYQMQWAPCPDCNGTGEVITIAEVTQVSAFEIDGKAVDAPGFEREQFITFVERAKDAQLRTTPSATPGAVEVLSGSSEATYTVTRSGCACPGHRRHHRCWHRASVIWLTDVQGVDVTRILMLGVSRRGLPLMTDRKVVAA